MNSGTPPISTAASGGDGRRHEGQARCSEAATALRPVAIGLHTDQGRLMNGLLARVAEGVIKHLRHPVPESSQT